MAIFLPLGRSKNMVALWILQLVALVLASISLHKAHKEHGLPQVKAPTRSNRFPQLSVVSRAVHKGKRRERVIESRSEARTKEAVAVPNDCFM
jgi:hypothetical protein